MNTNDYSKLFLGSSKLLLSMIGLWPKFPNRLRKISFVLHTAGATITLGGVTFYAFKNANHFNNMILGICILIVSLMAYSKVLFIWYTSDKIKLIYQTIMDEFWPYDIIGGSSKRHIVTLNKYTDSAVVLCTFTAVSYFMILSIKPLYSSIRCLPLLSEYPCEWWNKTPVYEILYIHQVIFLSQTVICGAFTAISLLMGLTLAISSQYCILRECLSLFNTQEMFPLNQKLRVVFKDQLKENYDVGKEFLVRCVKHHCMLLRITKDVNIVLNQMELMQLLSTTLTVGIGMAQFTFRDDITIIGIAESSVYMFGNILQFLMDCFLGTYLHYEASLLPNSLFHSNWLELNDEELKNDIKFFLQHCQRIPQISVYNMYDINMISFVKVLKLAFSVYTLMSKLQNT